MYDTAILVNILKISRENIYQTDHSYCCIFSFLSKQICLHSKVMRISMGEIFVFSCSVKGEKINTNRLEA